ncbi:MAG: MATE family efflux transporter [Fusicatenibacter sp.]|nr:MATE family efflux transporter [Fusicatenibacter sp.]
MKKLWPDHWKRRYQSALETAATIMILAWPTMLEQVMQTAVQYIDTAMVGTLGTQATAAVGATGTVGWLINGTFSALSVGFLSLISRACGAQDAEKAKRVVGQATLVVLVGGILSTLICSGVSGKIPVWMQVDPSIQRLTASYFLILYLPMLPRTASIIFGTVLRAAGDTRTPMKVGIIVNSINVVLNYLLIYDIREVSLFGICLTIPGAGLGVIGAAIASAVSFTWGGIHITWVLWKHPMVSPRGISLKPDMSILKPWARISFPNVLQRFGTSLGYVVFASMINALGEAATAAHTIANTVESAFYIPGYGMQTAAATLIGNAYGAKDEKRMKSLSAMFIPIEVVLMIGSGAVLFAAAPALVGLFSKSTEIISPGSTVLRMVAISEPFYGFSIIVEGMMMGVGKTRAPFVYNIIGMWCIRIVGTFLYTRIFHMGLVAAWGCMIAHNMLLFVLYLVVYVRGTWNPLSAEQ